MDDLSKTIYLVNVTKLYIHSESIKYCNIMIIRLIVLIGARLSVAGHDHGDVIGLCQLNIALSHQFTICLIKKYICISYFLWEDGECPIVHYFYLLFLCWILIYMLENAYIILLDILFMIFNWMIEHMYICIYK